MDFIYGSLKYEINSYYRLRAYVMCPERIGIDFSLDRMGRTDEFCIQGVVWGVSVKRGNQFSEPCLNLL